MKTPLSITAVWLRRIGDNVEVLAEFDGEWRKVITEHHEGNFSHIVESAGMRRAPKDDT